MKKLILLVSFIMIISLLLAELEVNIPFETDIIGDSFAANGAYVYESEWIDVTNTGSSTQDYTFMYSTANVPDGWNFSVCDHEACLMPDLQLPFTLDAGQTKQIHILINVESTGGFEFPFTFADGDLTEPLVINFSFNTEDNTEADESLLSPIVKLSNYPNPFNPETTIFFETIDLNDEAQIEIYNSNGQKIKSFEHPELFDGSVVWNGTDDFGKAVPSGIYLYRLEIGNYSISNKMILIK